MKNTKMPAPLSPGMWPDDDYEIKQLLSQDAVSISYLAHHSLLDVDVMLREFMPAHCAYRTPDGAIAALPGMESALHASYNDFVDNLRFFVSIKHPNLVSVQTAFSGLTGTVYGVQSLPKGKALPQAISAAQSDEKQLAPLLEQALDVFAYLQKKNMCPIDLTPDAFVLCDGVLKMNLFGNVRGINEQVSGGTPGYAPVELLQGGGKVGVYSIVYALGAVFYHVITGKAPMPSGDRIGKRDPYVPLASLSDLQKRFSLHFLTAIDKALCLWGEDRWQGYEDWKKALAEAPSAASTATLAAGALRLGSGGLRLHSNGGGLRLGGVASADLGTAAAASQTTPQSILGIRLGGNGAGGGLNLGKNKL